MPFLPQWKKSVITAVKCGCGLHMFSFNLVGVVSASVTVGSGVVLCGRQGEMYVGCNSTQVTKQAS